MHDFCSVVGYGSYNISPPRFTQVAGGYAQLYTWGDTMIFCSVVGSNYYQGAYFCVVLCITV